MDGFEGFEFQFWDNRPRSTTIRRIDQLNCIEFEVVLKKMGTDETWLDPSHSIRTSSFHISLFLHRSS